MVAVYYTSLKKIGFRVFILSVILFSLSGFSLYVSIARK